MDKFENDFNQVLMLFCEKSIYKEFSFYLGKVFYRVKTIFRAVLYFAGAMVQIQYSYV